jgi:hypothetical protein
LHNAGPAGEEVAGVADDGGADVVGGADVTLGLGEPVPGAVVVFCACGWPPPQAASVRTAAAAAVDMVIPWKIL